MKLPILYHMAKNDELRQWRTWADGHHIYTEYGTVGGKLQQSCKVAEGKNIGKSNETTPQQQAILEANALHKYKLERKYSDSPDEAQEELFLPMLAHKYEGSKAKKFKFPADFQPKVDGLRCLSRRGSNGEIQLVSRQGKLWNIPHISSELDKWMPFDMTLDGEIYIHGESCQYITSLAKSADPNGKSFKEDSHRLQYHIYDIPEIDGDDSLAWHERKDAFNSINESEYIKILPTHTIDERHMWIKYGEFMIDGYEGGILRGLEGKYLWGYRSSDLLKVKSFQDAEFTVVGAKDGRGKMENCVIWVCQNNISQDTFECSMKVSMEERRQMFLAKDDYISRPLTVRFFSRTDDGIPRFPVGITFRDNIDLP